MTKGKLKVEELKSSTLPPADPEHVTTTLDVPVRSEAKVVLGDEYSQFERLAKRLVSVPKKEIDAIREREAKKRV